jgi:hypothetical protein
MWLTIAKVALLSFIVIGVLTVVVTYVLRRRAGIPGWRPPNSSRYPDALRGGSPQSPTPDWVDWDDGDDPNNERSRNP